MRGEGEAPRRGRGLRFALGAFWGLAVVVITLMSNQAPEWGSELHVSLCVFCGSRGMSDALLNVVLFLPVGIVVGYRRGMARALAVGFLISAFIETSQFFLPGRNPSLGDLIWNTTGAGLGAVVVQALRSWLAAEPPLAARALVVTLLGIYLGMAGWLALPAGTDARYFGQWTQDLGFMEHYRGELLSAEINGDAVPWGPYPEGARPELNGDFHLGLRAVKGPPPGRIAPILSIYDALQQEILVFGALGEDLIWRQRDRAQAVGFDFREIRVPGALGAVAVGDTMVLSASRVGGELCLGLDGRSWCGLGFTPAGSWRFLMNLEGASPPFRAGLDLAWMATLFFLVGLLGGSLRSTLLLVVVSGVLVATIVGVTPLVPGGVADPLGLVLGVVLGVVGRPVVRRLVGLPPRS